LVTYRGNCHCGAFEFLVQLPTLERVHGCDCSICSRARLYLYLNAYLWVRPALNAHFTIEKGESALKGYEFGNVKTTHKFCTTCGTSVMCVNHDVPEGQDIQINARVLADIDLDALEVVAMDGSTLLPKYIPPTHPSGEPPAEGMVRYHGNCHCGAIRYTLECAPLRHAKSCNCSICSRLGVVWAYPLRQSLTVHDQDTLVEYQFGSRRIRHGFCGVCGVSVWEHFVDPARLDMGLNVRAINEFDWSALEIEKIDRKSRLPLYQV
ncbi:Mss4-like protein, partial [Mycena rebaudengoi]